MSRYKDTNRCGGPDKGVKRGDHHARNIWSDAVPGRNPARRHQPAPRPSLGRPTARRNTARYGTRRRGRESADHLPSSVDRYLPAGNGMAAQVDGGAGGRRLWCPADSPCLPSPLAVAASGSTGVDCRCCRHWHRTRSGVDPWCHPPSHGIAERTPDGLLLERDHGWSDAFKRSRSLDWAGRLHWEFGHYRPSLVWAYGFWCRGHRKRQ
jgi:hypothetical protein